MQWLQQLFGEQGAKYATWVFTALILLLVVLAAIWLVRKALGDRLNFSEKADRRGRAPRLGVTESFTVDRQGRRLVMVRRDNTEHLIMIGGPNDVVIESNIVRGERPTVGRGDAKIEMEVGAAAAAAVASGAMVLEQTAAAEPVKPVELIKVAPVPVVPKFELPKVETPKIEAPILKPEPPKPAFVPPVVTSTPVVPEKPLIKPDIMKIEPPKVELSKIETPRVEIPAPAKAVIATPANALDDMAAQLESMAAKASAPVRAAPPIISSPPLVVPAPAPAPPAVSLPLPVAAPAPGPAPTSVAVAPPPIPVAVPPAPAPAPAKNPFDSLEAEMARLLGRSPDGKS
jgi:flagellar protein FliO/FliZ